MDICADKSNLGLSQCAKLPNMIRSMITTPNNFKATPTQVIDPDFWQAALLDDLGARIYLWPNFVNFTDNSEAAVYETTPLAYLAVRDGRYNFKFEVKENLCLHKAMYTHRAIAGRVFFFDVDNQLIGTTDSDGNFMGFKIQLLNTEKLMISNGQVSTKSPIVVVLENNLELDQNGAIVNASFVNDLARLTDVTLTATNPASADAVVVAVTATCDGTPVSGLVLADFAVTKANGAAQTTPPTSCVEVNGVYTISKVAGTAWIDGFVNLVEPAALSIEAYEETGPATLNVP